ncbi:MAG: hypothetical protein R3C26_08080 [Calditrichia bacterium]
MGRYFKVPFTDRHTLTLRMQGGFIDTKVDSFFIFGGGLVGLKGYPFYSVEGRRGNRHGNLSIPAVAEYQ